MIVEFSVKAIDDVDGVVSVSCTPESGSLFSVGETIVMCTASDMSANSAEKSFSVNVISDIVDIPEAFNECTGKPAGTLCGDQTQNTCDSPDTCDGNGMCVSNFAGSDVVCRAGDQCTFESMCDGLGSCPASVIRSDIDSCLDEIPVTDEPSSDPVENSLLDSDGDGLSDEHELELGTDPDNPDTDGDGLTDGQEVDVFFTDPFIQDSDTILGNQNDLQSIYDSDEDSWTDDVDNCIFTPNEDQLDTNSNGVGDICEVESWVKDVAGWWSDGEINDEGFLQAAEYLIENGVIKVQLTEATGDGSQGIPEWIKLSAESWRAGITSDEEFIFAMTFLIEDGIIQKPISDEPVSAERTRTKTALASPDAKIAPDGKEFSFGGTLESSMKQKTDIMKSEGNISTNEHSIYSQGPKSSGNFLSETNSGKVCGLSLCSEELSIKQRIDLYKKAIGLK